MNVVSQELDDDERNKDEEDFLQSFLSGQASEEEEVPTATTSRKRNPDDVQTTASLAQLSALSVPERIQRLPNANLQELHFIIQTTMGSMAQCRGGNGKILHSAGVVPALTQVILTPSTWFNDTQTFLLLMGAVRDLACGNPLIRADFFDILPVLTEQLYSLQEAKNDIQDNPTSLKKATTLMGALRNLAHSNGRNGRKLHELQLTAWLIQYIQNLQEVPSPSDPDRELYFRVVGTLLGIVEKVDEAISPASAVTDRCCMEMSATVFHPGLLKLIRATHAMKPRDEFAVLLEKEARRQASARIREEQRKAKLVKKTPESKK